MNKEAFDRLSHMIRGAAMTVHRELGPGLLESVYEYCLAEELTNSGLRVETQKRLPVIYRGKELDKHFILDLLVEDEVIIELKCVEQLLPIHEVQLVTYLKLADKRLGLLINFNVTQITKGIKRKVNNFPLI